MVSNKVRPIQVTQVFDERGRQATSESSSGTDIILNIKCSWYFQLGTHFVLGILHFFSLLSGPIVSCISGSFLCLIPNQNILEQPSFWIEDLFYRFMAAIPIMIGQNLLRAEYWSNLTFEKRGLSYLILVGTGFALYACIMTGYSYLWIFHYGYNPPIPLNLHVGGSLTLIGLNIALWFRCVTENT